MIIVIAVYFAGFRDCLGMDYEGYRDLCERERVLRSRFWFLNEPLFEMVRSFCVNTSFSAVVFFLISAILTSAPALIVYSKSGNLLLSGFVYLTYTGLYLFSFNVVRQFASSGLLLLATYYFMKEQGKRKMQLSKIRSFFIKHKASFTEDSVQLTKIRLLYIKQKLSLAKPKILFALFFLAAFAYHKSAIIFLPFLFVRKDNYSEWLIVVLLVVSLFFPISRLLSATGIVDMLDMMDYDHYLEYDNSGVKRFSLSNMYMHALLVPFLVCKKRVLKFKNRKTIVFAIKMFALFLVCNNLSANGLPIAYRVGIIFSMFVPIALSVFPKLFDNQLMGYALIVIPLLVLFFLIGMSNELVVPDRMLPFNSIWDSVYANY